MDHRSGDHSRHPDVTLRGALIKRRFNDVEARRIFERAAAVELHAELAGSSDGHSLQDLHAIAQEAGLDPAAVDAAAADVVASEILVQRTPWRRTFSALLHADGIITGPLANQEMRTAMSHVEQIIGSRGLLTEAGPWVEWRDARNRLYVGMVRGEHLTRMRAIVDVSGEMIMGAAGVGLVGVLLLPIVADAGVAAVSVLVAALVATTGVLWYWRRRVARGYLRDLLDMITQTAGQ